MSIRSRASGDTPTTLEGTAYQFSLRVAYLVHLLQSRPAAAPSTPAPGNANESRRSVGDSWTASLYSIGDIFGKECVGRPSRSD